MEIGMAHQIPETDYLPPGVVHIEWKSARQMQEQYPPQTPEEVLACWKAIAEEEAQAPRYLTNCYLGYCKELDNIGQAREN